MKIESFSGEHRYLSNFWPAFVLFDGAAYGTVEHAYQAAKTLDPAQRSNIRHADTPGQAKRMGRHVAVRPDWEQVKIAMMSDFVMQKFVNDKALAVKLIKTGNAELIEGNTWNDTFWGVCRGKGQNHLGKILMRVRDTLVLA